MENEEKAAMFFREAAEKLITNGLNNISAYSHAAIAQEYAFQMALWKDEQFKQIVKKYIDLAYSSGQEANLLEDILKEL